MSESVSAGVVSERAGVRWADRRRSADERTAEFLVDCLWIVFFIGASSAFSIARIWGITNTERFVWFPADLLVVLFLLYRQKESFYLLRKNALFVSWAVLACASSVWSFAPWISIYHGIQMFFTIMVGLMLLAHADLRRIQTLVFTALLLCAIGSAVFATLLPQYTYSIAGGWLGLYPHKNVFGAAMLMFMMTAICLFLDGWRPVLSLFGIVFGAALLLLSLSAASVVSAAAALAAVPMAIAYRKGVIPFVICTGIAIAVLALGFMWLEAMDSTLSGVVLGGLGKEQTLTGRTVIWDFGWEAFESRPWLGYGFKGYWEGAGTSVGYLRYFIGQTISHFHNNFLEVAVAYGVVGPILLGVSYLVGFFRVVRAFVREPVYARLWPIIVLIIIFVACLAESLIFTNHSLYQVLFIIAVGSVFQTSGVTQPSNERKSGRDVQRGLRRR
jgi:O-antigen ligase